MICHVVFIKQGLFMIFRYGKNALFKGCLFKVHIFVSECQVTFSARYYVTFQILCSKERSSVLSSTEEAVETVMLNRKQPRGRVQCVAIS